MENGALTFFDTILMRTLEIRILRVAGDALNAFVEVVLLGRAFLGFCAF